MWTAKNLAQTVGQQSDAMLALAAADGHKPALEELLRRNWAWLRAVVAATVANPDWVDDIMQDVCLKVIDKIATLKEPERIRPWLAAIARNQAITALRQSAKQNRLSAQLVLHAPPPAVQRSSDQWLCDAGQALWSALEKLPEKYRQVFILKYAHDMGYHQIAEVLDIPFTTVQIRLVRSRRMLLEMLKTKEPFAKNQ